MNYAKRLSLKERGRGGKKDAAYGSYIRYASRVSVSDQNRSDPVERIVLGLPA